MCEKLRNDLRFTCTHLDCRVRSHRRVLLRRSGYRPWRPDRTRRGAGDAVVGAATATISGGVSARGGPVAGVEGILFARGASAHRQDHLMDLRCHFQNIGRRTNQHLE